MHRGHALLEVANCGLILGLGFKMSKRDLLIFAVYIMTEPQAMMRIPPGAN